MKILERLWNVGIPLDFNVGDVRIRLVTGNTKARLQETNIIMDNEAARDSLNLNPCKNHATQNVSLSLCDRTANMVVPWARAGYDCICVDLNHQHRNSSDGRISFVTADVAEWMPPLRRYAIVFAFPPCTDLAVSGARWFHRKGLTGLANAVGIVDACRRICHWSQVPYMIENPVSVQSSYWRSPDFVFNPCDYGGYLNPPGDAYTKKTCLWTGGGFCMPPRKPVEPVEGSRMHRLPPSSDRGNIRGETPKGFAQAVFLANAHRDVIGRITDADR